MFMEKKTNFGVECTPSKGLMGLWSPQWVLKNRKEMTDILYQILLTVHSTSHFPFRHDKKMCFTTRFYTKTQLFKIPAGFGVSPRRGRDFLRCSMMPMMSPALISTTASTEKLVMAASRQPSGLSSWNTPDNKRTSQY